MSFACRICIAKHGLKGSQLASLPKTEEELIEHMESAHHMPVRRDGESEAQATERFLKTYPEARTCDECREAGAAWFRT